MVLLKRHGGWMLVGLAAIAGLARPSSAWASGEAPAPTYHKDVAAILQKHCQDCHRPGQVAPFPLLTYENARKRSGDLASVTGERKMPPWPAATDFGGPFHDQRIMSAAEISTLQAWAEAGAPEGDPGEAPSPRSFPTTDWPLGEPDLVLKMPEPYALEAEGEDEFRVFVLKSDFKEDRWIRAVDYLPGNRRVVHHVISGVDDSGTARKLDQADPKTGYSAVGGFGPGVPLRGFLPIWTPGARARFAPEGAGYLLPAGADLLIQVHYHKSGKPETDATSIGLYLSDAPLPRQVRTGFIFPSISALNLLSLQKKFQNAQKDGRRPDLTEMMQDVLVIPAGEPNYVVKSSSKSSFTSRPLQRDILITSVMPHMHWLGKDFRFWAVLPDEAHTQVPLIKINQWDFNWQGTYGLVEPIRLPKGAWLEMEAHFDNSADNPVNPNKPPKTVRWGDGTNDEMCIGIYEFIPVGDAPRSAQTAKKP